MNDLELFATETISDLDTAEAKGALLPEPFIFEIVVSKIDPTNKDGPLFATASIFSEYEAKPEGQRDIRDLMQKLDVLGQRHRARIEERQRDKPARGGLGKGPGPGTGKKCRGCGMTNHTE